MQLLEAVLLKCSSSIYAGNWNKEGFRGYKCAKLMLEYGALNKQYLKTKLVLCKINQYIIFNNLFNRQHSYLYKIYSYYSTNYKYKF